ncbi:Capsule polysaccharide biosynthesis protein [Legionella beliardensis]|uniref:Capsule polysaccharide biosynthesis protein n=1 Tax=Legionella beliardensis TaxID=91822 RepID=A0A378I1M5_9GAMM|nr:hypothetical protein [Legionella beliardensis]STX28903.1 Capsule polysaccharide biosynthesis protein [Legionella beliardensis]
MDILLKRANYKRMLKVFTALPGLKQYIQLVKFVRRKIALQFINQSCLIQKTPSESLIKRCQDYPCYLYLPWIEALTNRLMEHLDSATPHVHLIPFPVFSSTQTSKNRQRINFFTHYNNQQLNQIIFAWLQPIAHNIRGFIFTFDYGLLQRQIIKICQQLAIPTILIPHESVFFNRNKYYLHPITGIDTPLCDYVLCWGQLQKDIFISRGYPAERINIVGAPKFDRYHQYQPQFSKTEFCQQAALTHNKKIIMFTAQTLDFQVQHKLALSIQRQIISELINYCQEKGCAFILRCPPTEYPIVDEQINKQMGRSDDFFIDSPSPNYIFAPEEAIYHADIIISINSTMLFEALLMGKKALSVKYFDFNEDWQRAGIKCVFNNEQLVATLDDWFQEKQTVQPVPTDWAVQSFSKNGFDGQATKRITEFLQSITIQPLNAIPLAIRRFITDEKPAVDLVYFPDLSGPFSYIPHLLNAKKIITNKLNNLQNWVEINCQVRERKSLSLNNKIPKTYIERGILCIGEEWTAITLDDLAYYDETNKNTRLQTFLEGKVELTRAQIIEAEFCINKIISQHVSFEFTKPIADKPIGRMGKPKILLLDEHIESTNPLVESYFKRMLDEAVRYYSDYDILIKRPDVTRKHKNTYLNQSLLDSYLKHHQNISIIDSLTNIYELFNQIEQLFVVNSKAGFLGLMAGKTVYCYGSPFYANWGLTVDKTNLVRRQRKRTLAELFYFSCISLSRYYSPLLARRCSLSEYLDYIFYLQIKQAKNK